MKRVLTALAVSLSLFASSVLAKEVHIIRNDPGGNLQHYLDRAERFRKDGTKVVIDGKCMSACLVFVMESSGVDVCATDRARLGFHMPSIRRPMGHYDRSKDAQRREIAEAIVSDLPRPLPRHFPIDKLPDPHKGAPPSQMLWVEADVIQKAIRPCILSR